MIANFELCKHLIVVVCTVTIHIQFRDAEVVKESIHINSRLLSWSLILVIIHVVELLSAAVRSRKFFLSFLDYVYS